MKELKPDLAIIPGGFAVYKPIKDQCCPRKLNEWLSSGNHTFTFGGRMCEPTLADVAGWVNWMRP